MKRSALILFAGLLLVAPASNARAQSPAELAQTAAYTASFQNSDGGFGTKVGGPSSLGATSSAIRVLKYTGGSIPDVLGCIRYVKTCFDKKNGGFAPTPGGQPDVNTTASGLMALGELKLSEPEIVEAATKYFSQNAKKFEEIRISIAGLEAVRAKSSDFPAWELAINEDKNDDGTFGHGASLAFDTGGKAAALLRMGLMLDKKEAIAKALKTAQLADGGWSREGSKTDFGATYRIMRCLYMMKEKPDLDRLRAFIAKCRQSDGSYATTPGGEGGSGTYFATVCLYWSRILDGEPAITETAGFSPLFNGKDLTGWEGDTQLWSARDGMLVGLSKGLDHNDFLATETSASSFVLKFNIRLLGDKGNSGVQFRSVRVPGHEMSGYQADIGPDYWASLYDESRRNRSLAQPKPEVLEKALHKDAWNHYVISAKGSDIELSLNGTRTVAYKEADSNIAASGKFAVQIHQGGPMEVQFKDIYLQTLPVPTEDTANTPGFHLRTLTQGAEKRKYVVFIPKGYDGTAPMPAVLFLHGSGERGEDGVKQAQTGLGPAILRNLETFKAIAVIPQARRTWAADSDDAKAALGALDEVMGSLKVDPKRIVLTGLSMGGHGAWEIAAAHPERFSAVVPICGRGRKATAEVLAPLPIWVFVGDADSDETVLNSRSMVVALHSIGSRPRYTEYRGVGHNSWDRAYNDTRLIEWMLAQTR